jgi:hypothetical protein
MRLISLLVLLLPCAPASAMPLAAHRAVYALSLAASPSGGVIAAHGRMTYDVQDACSGWTTAQHLELAFTNRDGQEIRMLSDYATFETKDGTRLTFHTRQMTDGAVTSQLDGEARTGAGDSYAEYSSPARKRVDLPPGTRLPLAHTEAILAAAESGRRFLSLPLFDGTDPDGAEDTFVTTNGWHPAPASHWPALARLPSSRVHVAFYSRAKRSQTPEYEIGMRYYANGVADELAMDFGDFTVGGILNQLEVRPANRC